MSVSSTPASVRSGNPGPDARSTLHRKPRVVPVEHPAPQVRDVLESKPGQDRGRGSASDARPADSNDILVLHRRQLTGPRRQLLERDQSTSSYVAELAAELLRLTHVEQHRL